MQVGAEPGGPHVTKPRDDYSSLARAMELTSRITTIALEMALPGLAGFWLGGGSIGGLGTQIVLLILGVLVGFAGECGT